MKKLAWGEFSEYIRRKNADFYGIVECFTCGTKLHWKDANAGHFHHGKLDFDEMNINVQCVQCNKWNHGRLGIYSINLIKKHGLDAVTELTEKAKRTTSEKKSRLEFEQIYLKYKEINEQS
jgi:hypothetical protein